MKNSNVRENNKSAFIKFLFAYFTVGFILAAGNLWDGISPFSNAFVASLPPEYAVFAAAGTILQNILVKTDVSLQRIIICIAILVIKSAVYLIFKKSSYIIDIVSCTVPSIVFTAVNTFYGADYYADIVLSISEITVSVALCYFFGKFEYFIKSPDKQPSKSDIGAVIVCLSALISSLNSFSFSYISIGTLSAVLTILCCVNTSELLSQYLSVAFFVVLSLNNPALFSYYAAIPPAVMITVAFAKSGKYLIATIFLVVSSTLGLLFGGISNYTLSLTFSLIAGSLLYVIIPQKAVGKLLSRFSGRYGESGLKSAIAGKLKGAAGSVGILADALDRLVKTPNTSEKMSSENIISNVCDNVCKKCRYCNVCWTEKYNDLADILDKVIRSYIQNQEYTPPHYFVNICYQPKTLLAEVKAEYDKQSEYIKSDNRLNSVKKSVSESYRTLSYMLSEISNELSSIYMADIDSETNLKSVLSSLKISFLNVSVVVKEYGRRFFEFSSNDDLDDSSLSEIISALSDRNLETYSPICKKTADTAYIYSFTEAENFKIVQKTIKLHQKSENISGDDCLTFSDSDGYFYSVLCDGEGTGEYAAAQSMVASSTIRQLCIGGIPLKSVIRTTGSMLISKDDRECSCTVDVVKVDKYTGNAEFIKAGGSMSILRHDGKIKAIRGKSIPIGIVGELKLFEFQNKLSAGDIIISLTDGAEEFAEDWLLGILSAKKCENMGYIEKIIDKTIKENSITFSDDATLSLIEIQSL